MEFKTVWRHLVSFRTYIYTSSVYIAQIYGGFSFSRRQQGLYESCIFFCPENKFEMQQGIEFYVIQ